MSQLASSVSKLESQGKLPSQTVINPKQNASAIVLRSGKELQENTDENGTKRGHAQQRKPEKEVEIPQEQDDETKEDNPKVLVTRPPFPERSQHPFARRYQTDTPLRKFLKELCTSKGKLKGNERVSMGENVSAILQRKLPPKCKDPGASINVMPLSIFESLHVGPLKETGVVIQLADRSVVYPEGVLEDVLVQKFPAIDDKDYIKLALEESPMPMEEENMGVDPLVQVNAKFDGDSAFLAKINKDLTYGPRTYKNKAFHDKISSRKNSLMNIKFS
ncbi:UNVERIFIED_CONTAM: hypothetical protein Sangu_2716500 [Sesamum angustifolium]|uniref:Uncharacterized protein n=1 Tax=Sesamum angustifolium TaxID=2727405 RepID=A0AAW2IZV5_9LAMI